jgi:hypothetical protein
LRPPQIPALESALGSHSCRAILRVARCNSKEFERRHRTGTRAKGVRCLLPPAYHPAKAVSRRRACASPVASFAAGVAARPEFERMTHTSHCFLIAPAVATRPGVAARSPMSGASLSATKAKRCTGDVRVPGLVVRRGRSRMTSLHTGALIETFRRVAPARYRRSRPTRASAQGSSRSSAIRFQRCRAHAPPLGVPSRVVRQGVRVPCRAVRRGRSRGWPSKG